MRKELELLGGEGMATPVKIIEKDLPRYHVRVTIDTIHRDEPTQENIYSVTQIETDDTGSLLLYKDEAIPSVGYGSGVWLKFEIIQKGKEK